MALSERTLRLRSATLRASGERKHGEQGPFLLSVGAERRSRSTPLLLNLTPLPIKGERRRGQKGGLTPNFRVGRSYCLPFFPFLLPLYGNSQWSALISSASVVQVSTLAPPLYGRLRVVEKSRCPRLMPATPAGCAPTPSSVSSGLHIIIVFA